MGAVARLGCCTFLIYISWCNLIRFDSEYKGERYRIGPGALFCIAKVAEGTVEYAISEEPSHRRRIRCLDLF